MCDSVWSKPGDFAVASVKSEFCDCAYRGALVVATMRSDLRAGRRAAILAEIETYLHDPKLAPQAIAARLGITSRYLRKLLEETGKSFSEHLLDKRLERAAALLRDPQRRGARIATIAYECGFSDLSYFNRVFRRRYGLTPSDMRAAAWPDDS